MHLQVFLSQRQHALRQPLAAGSIDRTVAGRHGGGVADYGIVGPVRHQFFPDFGTEGIPYIADYRRWNRVQSQGIEIYRHDGSITFDKLPVRIECPTTWSGPDIEDRVAGTDQCVVLLDLFQFVHGTGRIALFACSERI